VKKNKFILLILIFTVIIIFTTVFWFGRTRELTIVFPEMNKTQKAFVTPLVTLFKIDTGYKVKYLFQKSEDYSENLYYVINNFQLQEQITNSKLKKIRIKENKNISDVFYSNNFYIPVSWYPWGIYYDKSVFSELNLSVPETWEQFLDLCEELKLEGYSPVSLMTKIKWPSTVWFDYLNIRMNGTEFHQNVLAGKISFTDKRIEQVFLEIFNLFNKNYVYLNTDSFEWETMIRSIEDKNAVMNLSGSFFYENSSEEMKENLGWFSFPGNNKENSETMIVSSSGFVIPMDGKNKKAAVEFIQFAQSEKGQGVIMRNSNLISVNELNLNKLDRDDISAALKVLDNRKYMLPSFERNAHPQLIIPLKSAISSIYSIENENAIKDLLQSLEEYRLTIDF